MTDPIAPAMRYAERLSEVVGTLSNQLGDLTREMFGVSEETADIWADIAEADALLSEWWAWRGVEITAGRYRPPTDDDEGEPVAEATA